MNNTTIKTFRVGKINVFERSLIHLCNLFLIWCSRKKVLLLLLIILMLKTVVLLNVSVENMILFRIL